MVEAIKAGFWWDICGRAFHLKIQHNYKYLKYKCDRYKLKKYKYKESMPLCKDRAILYWVKGHCQRLIHPSSTTFPLTGVPGGSPWTSLQLIVTSTKASNIKQTTIHALIHTKDQFKVTNSPILYVYLMSEWWEEPECLKRNHSFSTQQNECTVNSSLAQLPLHVCCGLLQ